MDLTFKKTMTSANRLLKSLVTLFLLGTSVLGTAQNFRYPVVARVTQNAPYPIYLQDYANPSQNNFSIQLEVRDNSLPLRSIRLKLYISGPAGIIQSTPFVRNQKIIELAAGQFYDLPAPDVANYFQNYNLQVSPQQYSQPLVDGTYQFGIEVIDAFTNQPLSGIQYGPPVWIVVNEPPIPFNPTNESVVSALDPQSLIFQWIPRHKNVSDVSYEFSITELNVPLDYTGNIQNLFLSQPPIYTEITQQTQLNYDFSLPPLIPGKIYAYRVRAIAKNGFDEIGMFRNNGFSEIRWFRYLDSIEPPYNEQVFREPTNNGFKLNWSGFENHQKYLIRYRQKQEEWKTVELPIAASVVGLNEHEFLIGASPADSYEFQIGVEGNAVQENVWGKVMAFKDPLPRPVTNTPQWKTSEVAEVSWYGNSRYVNYQLAYRDTKSEEWLNYRDLEMSEILVEEENQIFNLNVMGLDSTKSHYFKITGIDFEDDQASSEDAYLKYWNIESILRLQEKSVSGNLFWSFLDREKSLGRISGSIQDSTTTLTTETLLVHNEKEVSGLKYPLDEINVEIFADTNCTVLLKAIEVSDLGAFKISFPAEGLRGGLLPSKLVLRVKHPAFGEFKKEINTTIFDENLDIGDWIIPAKTFRFTPVLTGLDPDNFYPQDHNIKLYRRVSGVNIAPYLKYENFGNGQLNPVKINNEDYFLAAELKPGQTAAGMFYGRNGYNPINQFLVIVEGPTPYEKKMLFQEMSEQNGVYELRTAIQQNIGQPHIYGDIIFDEPSLSGSQVKLELTSSSGHSETIVSVSPYRFNLPLSELEQLESYTIRTYVNNQFKSLERFNLNPESLGTSKDLLIGRNKMVAVVAQLRDNEGKLLGRSTFTVNGMSYQSNISGVINFWAQENTEVEILLQKPGYIMSPYRISINNQLPNNEELDFENNEGFRNRGDLKSKLKADLNRLKSLNASFLSSTAFPSWEAHLLSLSAEDRLFNSINEYHGASLIAINTDARLKPFTINFKIQDLVSQNGINGVSIVENDLDQVGKTNNQGIITFKTTIGRGTKVYKLIPALNSGYSPQEIAFEFPDISSDLESTEIIVRLDGRSFVEGTAFEEGTGEPLANTTITIEYLTTFRQMTTDANGKYKLFGFEFTDEENFLIITAEKDGYFRKVVHMATAKSYGFNFERDVYLKPLPATDEDLNSDWSMIRLYGFKVSGSFINWKNTGGKNTFDFIGTLYDQEGNSYSFVTRNSTRTVNEFRNLLIIMPSTSEVVLTPKGGQSLYCNQVPVAPSLVIYAKPYGNTTISYEGQSYYSQGVIYTESLSFDLSKMSADLQEIYEASDHSNASKISIDFNEGYTEINKEETPFPIAHSGGGNPILKIELFPNQGSGKARVEELKSYYQDYAPDRAKVTSLFENSGSTESLYEFKNFVFASISIRPRGIELNNLVVMPLMSLDNVHISLLNIDRLRLAYDTIDEVLIDYSQSPRKISFGEDIVQAQIEEVHASDEGIDIVYFTNNGGNVIKPASPDISEIQYNANGIFYSDYKNQKELVQTAAVLNPVYMNQFPTPAMGPGNRIKIRSSIDIDPSFSANAPAFTTSRGPSGSTSSGPTPSTTASPAPQLFLSGTSTITLQPHIFIMKWKYENNTQKWKTDLVSFKSTDFWGYTVLRPVKAEIGGAKRDSTEYIPGEAPPETDLRKGILNVTYGINIPIVGSLTMQSKASWDNDKSKFVRENVQAEVNTSIASILSFNAKFIMLLDSAQGNVEGLFAKISGSLKIDKASNISIAGAGGYINMNKEPIFGFSATQGSDASDKVTKDAAGGFSAKNISFAFLLDFVNDAMFLQMAADLGFGKKQAFDTPELRQFTPEPKSAIEKDRRAAKDKEITKRWQTAKEQKKEGLIEPKIVLFNEMFMMGAGNSGLEADTASSKNHKVAIKKAEVGIAISATQGVTITGSGILSLEGVQLLEAAFLVSLVNVTQDSTATNWRVFVGIPSFTKAQAGSLTDLSADLQVDFGNQGRLPNFLLMGGIQADWPVHPVVYLKLGAKFVLAVNAEANTTTLASSTRAGGQTLSKTASVIVKFMGSNFNSIAEKSIQQRTSFFNAIDKETFIETKYELDDDGNIADSSDRFSGFYIGLKATVMFGINKNFENDLVAGSARFGIGLELGAGLLKSFSSPALELRFKAGIVAEINIRARAPIEADLLNASFDLPSFCAAGLKENKDEDWKWRFLVTLAQLNDVLGTSVVADPACNTFGLFYFRPCIFIQYYHNAEIEYYKDGKLEFNTVPNNFSATTCPIEW
jgi:hypothetical protein